MKIYLINPAPLKKKKNQKETFFYASSPPLGLMYLATYLKDSGYEISILDQAAVKYENRQETGKWIEKDMEEDERQKAGRRYAKRDTAGIHR